MPTKTKIICTIGPASKDPAILKELINSGMSVCRLNLSHGTHEEHAAIIKSIRSISKKVSIMIDLQGPRIRIGNLKKGKLTLIKGKKIILCSKAIQGTETEISLNPPQIVKYISINDSILISDARLRLRVVSKSKGKVVCIVEDGGELLEHKGVNLPDTKLSLPSVTKKDKKDIAFAIDQKVDFIALSFVRQALEINYVKRLLAKRKSSIHVIAKLEKPEAIENIDEILIASDGVMVARGDLGIEMSLAKVPIIQKEVIKKSTYFSKPVIIATQMLESMVSEDRPTRAEASDVANAIFDGADAVMLSEETAAGKYPVIALQTMSQIVSEAENSLEYFLTHDHKEMSTNNAVSFSACEIASEINAKAIVTFTECGSTALRVSKYRPKAPIIGVVTSEETFRQLSLYFGVKAIMIKPFKYIDQMIQNAEKALLKERLAKDGDTVVLTAGIPINVPGTTNLVKVHKIGSYFKI